MADYIDYLAEDSPNTSSNQYIDYLAEPEQESYGRRVIKAPFRIAEDLYKGATGFIKNAPGYLEQAKTEVPGLVDWSHPGDRARQTLAGLAEMGHGILGAPAGISNYLTNRLELTPKNYNEWVQNNLRPADISEELEMFAGNPVNPGDALLRGAARNAMTIIPAAKAVTALNPLNLTPKNITKDILKAREQNMAQYGNKYDKFWKSAEKKGFGDALYDVNIDIPTIQKYSPQKGIKGVLDFDANPTLQNAHNAKSDLLRIKRDLEKQTTLRAAERQQLKAINDGIDSINKNMFKDSSGKINQKFADQYNRIQQGYKENVLPYKNTAINEYLRNEISEKELVNALSKKSFARQRGKFHPEMKRRETFQGHPYLTGAAGATGLGWLYNQMFGNTREEE
jgi:hypothetical protein